MQDRIPLYPGRVTMTPVAGQANTFDMVRADDPTQEGTPLNKATFLKDATAALYGMGASAVPDDVLAELGKYKQYWWRRRLPAGDWEYLQSSDRNEYPDSIESNGYVVNVGNIISEKGSIAANDARTPIKYADAVITSQTGTLSLVSPSELTVSGTTASKYNVLKGKYILLEDGATTGITSGFLPTGVYYIPDDAIFSISASSRRIVSVDKYAIVTAIPLIDGYEYEYLGIPLDNAVTAPRIETGSYVGTGTYGASNPNTLTFVFVPKFVIFIDNGYYNGSKTIYEALFQRARNLVNCELLPDSYGDSAYFLGPSGYSGRQYTDWKEAAWKTNGGKTINWLSTNSAVYQFNEINKTYYYIAIG